MLFLRLTAIASYAVYIFLCNLPRIHKMLYPFCLASMTILVVQSYFYDKNRAEKKWLRFAYLNLFCAETAVILLGQWHPAQAGMLAGWVAVAFGICSDLPQIYRNWCRKSMVGFNILFSSFIGFGGMCDLALSLYFGLPLPTVITTARVVVCYLVYVTQFIMYRGSSR